MPHYNVVIETRRERDPSLFGGNSHIHATVAEGPDFVRPFGGRWDTDARNAYESLRRIIRGEFPGHAFDFMHVEQ